MFRKSLLASLLALACSSALRGEGQGFEVKFLGFGDQPTELSLTAENAKQESTELLLEVDSRGRGSLERALENGPWMLSCSAPEFWCLPFSVDEETQELAHQLIVFPAGRLEGRLEASGVLPKRFQIQAWAASEETTELTFGHNPAIESGRFGFKVPAIPLDLRLAFRGWGPVYSWDVEPESGGTYNLGSLPLRAGGSLCAFVAEEATGLPAVGAKVILRAPPPPPGVSAEEFARIGRIQWQTTVNSRGFFQISGIMEGRFQLELTRGTELLESPGDPTLLVENIAIAGAAETCLDDLYLPEKDVVAIRLTPTHAPGERPWTLTLRKANGPSMQPVRAVTDELGVVHMALSDGDYRLFVSAGERRVLRREMTVSGPTEVDVEMDLVRVRGKIELGGEPLVTHMRLIGDGTDVSFESTLEGTFEGWISNPEGASFVAHFNSAYPAFSRWMELGSLESQEGEVVLNLDLDDRFLEGFVKDSEGRALRRASVVAVDASGMSVTAHSDVEGRFRLEGLGPGRFRVWATLAAYGSSETRQVELGEAEQPSDIQLTISPGFPGSGRLQNAGGRPVAGARLWIRFPGHSGWNDTVTSGADGGFDFRAPDGASQALVTVSAPSAGMLWSVCSALSDGELLLQMPQAPSGTIHLASEESAKGSSPLGLQIALLTSDGGLLTDSVLGRWAARLGAWTSQEELGTRVVPGLAPGFYEAVRIPSANSELGCQNGTSRNQWQQLAPGGELTLRPR